MPIHRPSTASLAELSYSLHAQLAKELDGSARWGYRKLDTLSISADLSSSSAAGGKASRVRKLKESDLFNWLNKDLLTSTEVLGSEETTAQVHPELFTRAIADEAQKEGVEVVYGTAQSLERLEGADDGCRVSVSPRTATSGESSAETARSLEFDQVVVAAGPWTGRLLSTLGPIASRAGRAKAIRGSRAHSIVVRSPEGKTLPAQALFTSIKEQKDRHAEPEIYSSLRFHLLSPPGAGDLLCPASERKTTELTPSLAGLSAPRPS